MTAKTLITSRKAIVHAYGKKYEINNNSPDFKHVVELLNQNKTRAAIGVINKQSKNIQQAEAKIVGNTVEFRGKKLHPVFAEAYVLNKKYGLSVEALDKFFANLNKNPNPISVDAFCNFLTACKMPITDRGTFLAYKKINEHYRDCHTNTFDNRPGCTNKMPREEVDSKQSNTCSTGFHVCNYNYLSEFTGRYNMVVEINPMDVVAVPPDYALSKMRVCEYTVLCTLDKFKDIVKSNYQDVLGNHPCFNTSQLEEHDLSV